MKTYEKKGLEACKLLDGDNFEGLCKKVRDVHRREI